MRLKIKFSRTNCTVAFQVLEQEGDFTFTNHVRSEQSPDIAEGHVFIRGEEADANDVTVCRILPTIEAANNYINRIIGYLDEFMRSQSIIPKRGDMVEVKTNTQWWDRKFITIVEDCPKPFVCQNTTSLEVTAWKKLKQQKINMVFTKLPNDTYEWEEAF